MLCHLSPMLMRSARRYGYLALRTPEDSLGLGTVTMAQESAPVAPDNSAVNVRDRDPGAMTAGEQSNLIGMGIPEYEAKRYEGKVKDGNILLSIHTEDSRERDRAKKILEYGGAVDISYIGEASVPNEQRSSIN
jgi:hypothetical protein